MIIVIEEPWLSNYEIYCLYLPNIVSVKLINYKKDGTKFLNQFFLCPLHDEKENVVYFLGKCDNYNVFNMDYNKSLGILNLSWATGVQTFFLSVAQE